MERKELIKKILIEGTSYGSQSREWLNKSQTIGGMEPATSSKAGPKPLISYRNQAFKKRRTEIALPIRYKLNNLKSQYKRWGKLDDKKYDEMIRLDKLYQTIYSLTQEDDSETMRQLRYRLHDKKIDFIQYALDYFSI